MVKKRKDPPPVAPAGEGPGTGEESIVLPAFGFSEEILGRLDPPAEASAPQAEASPGRMTGAGAAADEAPRSPGAPEAAVEDQAKFVTFHLDREEYALPIAQVQEINRVGEITKVPNAPAHVIGVINLRGKILPVIELKKRLNLGTTTAVDKHSRVVVAEQGPRLIGLLVDRVSQVINIASSAIEEAPREIVQTLENYITGVGKVDDRMIIILDLERIVGREAAR
jgi:purine-binding chemotaxis protein CheW